MNLIVHKVMSPAALSVGLTALLIACWHFLANASFDSVKYLPSPLQVIDGFGALMSGGTWQDATLHTLRAVATASVIAIVMGALVGVGLGLMLGGDKYYISSLDFMRTIPAIIFMPLVILIWGPTLQSEVIITTWVAFWPMVINTMAGVRRVPSRLNEVAKIFAFSRTAWIFRIVIPSSFKDMLVGARLAVVNALIVAITAEMLFSGAGLGWEIFLAQQALKPENVWALALTCCALGYVLNTLLLRGTGLLFPAESER